MDIEPVKDKHKKVFPGQGSISTKVHKIHFTFTSIKLLLHNRSIYIYIYIFFYISMLYPTFGWSKLQN